MPLNKTYRRNALKAKNVLRRFNRGVDPSQVEDQVFAPLLAESDEMSDVVEENGNRYFYPTLKGSIAFVRGYLEMCELEGWKITEKHGVHNFDLNLPDDHPDNLKAAQKWMQDRHAQTDQSRANDRAGVPDQPKKSSFGQSNSRITKPQLRL